MGADRTVAATLANPIARPRPIDDRLCLQGILFVLHSGIGVRLRNGLLAAVAPLERGRDLRPAPLDPAGRPACRQSGRLVPGGRRRSPPAGQKGGAGVGPSPVDRDRLGSQHHLICDGGGLPLKVLATSGNVHDVSKALDLVDRIPPVAGRPGRPRRRPDALLADKGYDSDPLRYELSRRCIVPIISYRGTKGVQGLGKLRYVVEQTLALLPSSNALSFGGNATSTSTTLWSPSPAP